jgi:hypothetical protein
VPTPSPPAIDVTRPIERIDILGGLVHEVGLPAKPQGHVEHVHPEVVEDAVHPAVLRLPFPVDRLAPVEGRWSG